MTRREPPSRRRIALGVAALVLVLPACGDDASDGAAPTTATAESITIDGVWARVSVEGQPNGATYFSITSSTDDVLVGATVSTDVAREVQIHEMVPVGDAMGDMTATTMAMEEMTGTTAPTEMQMMMQELEDGLPLPAGETVLLKPGGFHAMLIGLAEPLEIGDTFDMTLRFEHAADIVINVEVRETAP